MLESLMCPGCSTHFGLRPERVREGIKRAQCFRCHEIFNIEEAVTRLLQIPATPVPEPDYSAFAGIEAGDLLDMEGSLPAGAPEPAPFAPEPIAFAPEPTPFAPEPVAFGADPFAVEAPPAVEPAPAEETLEEPAPAEDALDLDGLPDAPTTLTLGDLEGADAEILDKTVVYLQSAAAEEPVQEMEVPAPEYDEPRPGATYSSARDAINKLLGGASTPLPPPSPQAGSGLVEATLTAMDSTLRIPLRPTSPEAPEAREEALPALNTASTVKISSRDLMAAIASAPPPEPHGAQDPNLLKLQIGDETFNNLTPDTVNAWISMGRLQEHHLVARQFSDHWIEASKVPILRPAFDQIRKVQAPEPPLPPPPPEPAPVKRSLFGGLFGRN